MFILAAVACAAYGLVVLGARSGTKFFMVWFAGAFFFLVCALLARFGWPSFFPAWVRYAFYAIVASGVLLAAVVEANVLKHFRETADPDLDYIVVLGAQIRETGPTVVLRWRLDAAYEYLVENPETVCIVAGGQGANEPRPEAEAMRDYLVEAGISPERIVTETASRNTIENIRNVLELPGNMAGEDGKRAYLLDPANDTVGIVTNDFHMFRALAIARKQGIVNAQGISAHSLALFLPNNMLREVAGVLKDKLLGNM